MSPTNYQLKQALKRTLGSAILLFALFTNAQNVVIAEGEEAADASAILDIQSTDKGMLIPRMMLDDVNTADPITNPANGLFIFSEGGAVSDGLYYWNETAAKWVYVITSNDITDFGSGQVITTAERAVISNIDTESLVPVGTIVPFAAEASKVPSGWLLCDGTPYLRSEYPNLFQVIGETWGDGDGLNTFNVPELRGYFLRGVDAGAGNDPDASIRTASGTGGNDGDAVGSLQSDAFQGHWHLIGEQTGESGNTRGFVPGSGHGPPAAASSGNNGFVDRALEAVTDGTHGTPNLSAETRPKNAYVNYIIKY